MDEALNDVVYRAKLLPNQSIPTIIGDNERDI